MSKQIDVSCIIALHMEGRLAHTTLISIEQARVFAEAHGLSVEFVITLDNHDPLTDKIARNHPCLRSQDKIEAVQYGNLGLSRNHAIALASGDYIVTMNGDDYYSRNYIATMVAEARKGKQLIAYPEYLFNFDAECNYLKLGGPENTVSNSYALFSAHHFCSWIAAHRDIFLSIPYVRCNKGYGFEDWHWSCEAKANGLVHKVAPRVVLFYRRRARSMAATYALNNAVISPSRFFSCLPRPEIETLPQFQRKQPLHPSPIPWKNFAKAFVISLLRALPAASGKKIYSKLVQVRNSANSQNVLLEPVIHTALLEAAQVDGALHPATLPSTIPCVVPVHDEMPGRVYAAAWHSLPRHDYDIVFTVPRIQTGGADLMARNYIRATCSAGSRVLCICTDGRPNFLDTLPNEAQALELGALSAVLPKEQRFIVLTRLLVQLAPKIIHMVNDYWGWECILRYGAALTYKSRLISSIFADAQDDNDIFYGAGTRYLRVIYPYVSRIITDNTITVRDWVKRFALPESWFKPVYGLMPAAVSQTVSPKKRNRVLWAGRLDTEKRLDILFGIAKLAPNIHFDVYGAPVLAYRPDPAIKKLSKLPNITLHGRYENFFSLPIMDFFALCYTTQCDGLPNVLLEATSAGMPVVAPDRGGIRDFITNETGWLIPRHTDIQAYINALREIRDDPSQAELRQAKARTLLAERHNDAAFIRNLFAAYDTDIKAI